MFSPQQFLILNGAVVTLLLVYFFGFRGKRTPSRLNFSKKDIPLAKGIPAPSEASTVLNVMFNYNGHSFDAYEVLGVPAGSTLEEIRVIYEQNRKQLVDPSSHELFKMAFEAISQHLSKR